MLSGKCKRSLVTAAVAAGLAAITGVSQAGQIVSDAPQGEALKSATSEKNKQFGFGGWNMDNVDVSIISTIDGTPSGGTYDKAAGTYSDMFLLQSFVSRLNTGGEFRGELVGKAWPVGEPAGVKVVNSDLSTKNGRPQNCIMTTSYLDSGYLDAGNNPTLCSSGFQTHKRFKILMQPSMVSNTNAGEGLPVEMSFNLAPDDSSTQRYQVFQKLNNYTGKRLDGYKIEVVDQNGSPNPALTMSIGIGENPGEDGTPGDIWDNESIANFSHGLWGPVDHHFDQPGFFDSRRVYYSPQLSSENQVLAYQGPVLGGNYQSLFGDWLPSGWEPVGIFHDDDMNPATDGVLKAFWGDPQNTGSNAWHKGHAENWATATEEDLLRWTGEWYEQGEIEDVLNLGVNFIVNVGDNASIGNKFTIRFIPNVAADQTPPAFVSNPPPEANYSGSEAIVALGIQLVPDDAATEATETQDGIATDYAQFRMAEDSTGVNAVVERSAIVTVGVADGDMNTDPSLAETVEVTVMSDHGESELVVLRESGQNTGRFVGTLAAEVSNAGSMDNDGKFNLNRRTNLNARYIDNKYGDQVDPQTVEASLDIDVRSVPGTPDEGGSSGSSSSFDAQDNTSFLVMLFGLLGIGGLIARRKLEPVRVSKDK